MTGITARHLGAAMVLSGAVLGLAGCESGADAGPRTTRAELEQWAEDMERVEAERLEFTERVEAALLEIDELVATLHHELYGWTDEASEDAAQELAELETQLLLVRTRVATAKVGAMELWDDLRKEAETGVDDVLRRLQDLHQRIAADAGDEAGEPQAESRGSSNVENSTA